MVVYVQGFGWGTICEEDEDMATRLLRFLAED